MFDIQNSGKIPAKDVGTAVRSIGCNPSESEVKAIIKLADKKGSNKLVLVLISPMNCCIFYLRIIKRKFSKNRVVNTFKNAFHG